MQLWNILKVGFIHGISCIYNNLGIYIKISINIYWSIYQWTDKKTCQINRWMEIAWKLPHLDRDWRRHWHPTPVLLPGKSHGQMSLVGCSPWGRKESDMTERLQFHFSLSCIGEGNGKPLQCSCLENPRDGGAWWAAVYGVAQSWTRLKWLSSSRKFIDLS